MDDDFLNVPEAAKRMGMSTATLRTRMSREPWLLPAHYRSKERGRGRILFRSRDVDDYMETLRIEPPPPPDPMTARDDWAKWRDRSKHANPELGQRKRAHQRVLLQPNPAAWRRHGVDTESRCRYHVSTNGGVPCKLLGNLRVC